MNDFAGAGSHPFQEAYHFQEAQGFLEGYRRAIPLLDGELLLADLDALGVIGLEPGRGLQRMAYGSADLAARRWVAAQMAALGLDTWTDPAGNVIGRLPGRAQLPAIAVGSHTDSVPGGGKYDGALGVLGAMACVRTLHEAGVALRHPLLVIDFAAEEATTAPSPAGSLSMVGRLTESLLEQPAWTETSTRTLLESAGFDPAQIVANRPPEEIAAYLELHIEQGDFLDADGIEVGVVTGIVGIRRYFVTFRGQANHAGTTSMARRKDALVAAAPFISAVREVAVSHGIVGTIGQMRIHPGTPNVIPGQVDLDLEIRAMDESVLDRAEAELKRLAIAGGATFEAGLQLGSTPADAGIMAAIAAACTALDLTHVAMPSGAGHDAMNMATICPYGMIFVPSVGGVSHAPNEFTPSTDCVNGTRVLLATLLKLDQDLNPAAARTAQ